MSNHISHPVTGILASAGSVITSFQIQLDWGVRFAGSAIFLLIAVISAVRAIRDFDKPSK